MLPPLRFRQRQRTSIGQLIAGQETEELQPLPLEVPGGDGAAGVADHKNTRELLELHAVAAPRPWAPPPEQRPARDGLAPPLPWAPQGPGLGPGPPEQRPERDGLENNLRAPFLRPKWSHDVAPAMGGGPDGVWREQDAAHARLAARIAACERRMEAQETREAQVDEMSHRMAMELKQARDAHAAYARLADDRFSSLETSSERGKREEVATREQLHALQVDFRDFAVSAVSKQRAEIENEVTAAFTRQRLSEEEWRAALKHRDAQLQGDIRRLSASVEDVSGQLVSAQAELRTRLSGLEASSLAGRSHQPSAAGLLADGGADAGPYGQALEYMRQQVEQLRQSSSQAGAGLTEMWARLEGEAVARGTLQRDHEARILSLDQAILQERNNLGQLVIQRLEVLEARLGVERTEVAAKQALIRDEMAHGDNEGHVKLQDWAARAHGDLEAAERRMQAEIAALRRHVESNLAQMKSAQGAEDEARHSSLAALLRRVETSAEQQMQAATKMQKEVNAGFKEIREEVRAECTVRAQAEQRLVADVGSSSQTLASEVGAVRRLLQQHAESVVKELERLRQTGAERADCLSRYVDEKIAQVGTSQSNGDVPATGLAEVSERVQALRTVVEEQARQAEQRLEATAEDLRLRWSRSEEVRVSELAAVRTDAERATSAAERRTMAAQEELQARFDAYVKHFDSTVQSVQAAILKPDCHEKQSDTYGFGKALPSARLKLREVQRLGQPPQPQLVQVDAVKPQQEELRTTVDGLRVHSQPDVASEVRKVLPRGEVVVVTYLLSTRDNSQWARLADSSGYVLSCSKSGAPLLESVQQVAEAMIQGPSVSTSSMQVRAVDDIAERMVAHCVDQNFAETHMHEACSTPGSDTSPRLLLSPEASVALERARRQAATGDTASDDSLPTRKEVD